MKTTKTEKQVSYILKTICSYCKTLVRETPVREDPCGDSHGICPACYASQVIPQLKKLKKH